MRREEGEKRKTWHERNGGPSHRYSWQDQIDQGIAVNKCLSGQFTT